MLGDFNTCIDVRSGEQRNMLFQDWHRMTTVNNHPETWSSKPAGAEFWHLWTVIIPSDQSLAAWCADACGADMTGVAGDIKSS